MIEIKEIMSILPHAYPFLLVDRIVEIEPGKRIVGIKNVTYNETFFPGHFPGRPIMPLPIIPSAPLRAGPGPIPEKPAIIPYFWFHIMLGPGSGYTARVAGSTRTSKAPNPVLFSTTMA